MPRKVALTCAFAQLSSELPPVARSDQPAGGDASHAAGKDDSPTYWCEWGRRDTGDLVFVRVVRTIGVQPIEARIEDPKSNVATTLSLWRSGLYERNKLTGRMRLLWETDEPIMRGELDYGFDGHHACRTTVRIESFDSTVMWFLRDGNVIASYDLRSFVTGSDILDYKIGWYTRRVILGSEDGTAEYIVETRDGGSFVFNMQTGEMLYSKFPEKGTEAQVLSADEAATYLGVGICAIGLIVLLLWCIQRVRTRASVRPGV